MFATEEAAVTWSEDWHWPTGEMAYMRYGSMDGVYRVKSGKPDTLSVSGLPEVLQPEDQDGNRLHAAYSRELRTCGTD